jgi:hypothetical protein
MSTYDDLDDILPRTLGRSATINTLDDKVAAAFALLPDETKLKLGTVNFAVDTGIADAYLVALPHDPGSYVDGLKVRMRPLYTNTGAATVNVNSLGVKSIKLANSSNPAAGDINAGAAVELIYSSSTGFFHIAPNSSVAAAAAVVSAAAALVSQNAASASAAAASLSESAAAVSETNAETAETNAETAQTAAELAETNAETAQTAAELAETNAETAETNAGVSAAAAAADLVLTNADVVLTHADVVLTHADVVLTNADAAATAADVLTTNADVVLTNADAAATAADVLTTNADVVLTNADAASTAADVITTNADVVSTNADAASTAIDAAATAADVVTTNADVVTTNADVVTTNADAASTAADAASVATIYDSFDDRYLGAKASDPTVDNDGDALLTGALYFNTVSNTMRAYNGAAWGDVNASISDTAYGAGWNGATTTAPSKNAVYDKMETKADKGANSDITSLAGLTTPLTVAQGGQGSATLADGGLLVGAAAGPVEVVAPGATTEILVGGGAGTNPVWTTVTGTGAPVKATSPTLVTPLLGTPTSGDLTNCTAVQIVTDLTPQLYADLDGQGNYAVDLQNFPDMLSNGPGYWFDGVDDLIRATDDFDAFNDDPVSLIVRFKASDIVSAQQIARWGTEANKETFGISLDTESIKFAGWGTGDFDTDLDIVADVWHTVVITYDGTTVTPYLDGEVGTTGTHTLAVGSNRFMLGAQAFGAGGTSPGGFFHGEISQANVLNLALTAAEVKAFSNGAAIPYKYIGASQTEKIFASSGDADDNDFDTDTGWWTVGGPATLAGGTVSWSGETSISRATFLTPGKRYRIVVDVTTDTTGGSTGWKIYDGSAAYIDTGWSGTGTQTYEFTALGTFLAFANGTGSSNGVISSFYITQIGCVLDLNPSGVTTTQWLDNSGNSLHGTVSGAKVINRPVQKIVQQNLLTNSGFEIWSNSTLLEATSGAAPVLDGANAALVNNLLTNGGFDSATTGWTISTGAQEGSMASVAGRSGGTYDNVLEITRVAGTYQYAIQIVSGLTVGKLYQIGAYVKSGTSGDENYTFGVGSGATNLDNGQLPGFSSSSWVGTSFVFEALFTSLYVTVVKQSATAGTMLFDSVTLYEVTPGCVAADTLGPDGWIKTGSASQTIYREHWNGTGSDSDTVKAGSFYALKSVASGVAGLLTWNGQFRDKAEWYTRFYGKTLTFGVWVKTSTASAARMSIYDSGYNYSGYHTGGGGWEWLEVTRTIANLAAYGGQVDILHTDGSTIYISQPTLIFGDHIGEGNYSRPSGEVVWFETYVRVEAGTSPAAGATAKNTEAWASGKVGKGINSIYVIAQIQNSAANKQFQVNQTTTGVSGVKLATQVANITMHLNGWVPTDSNGDVAIVADDANFTGLYLDILGVRIR